MRRSRNHPQLLVAGLGPVKRIDHPRRHVIVGVAVDEQHRQPALLHLLQRRSLAESPAVFQAAQPARRVEQRKGRKPELLFKLFRKLVPDARIAAILDETFHIGLLLLARDHHGRRRAHRNPVDHHPGVAAEDVVGNVHPPQHVEAVLPPHPDGTAFALPVVIKVRQQDVAAQVAVVEIADHQHPHGVVRIAVDDHRRPVRRTGSRRIDRVQSFAFRSENHRVAQGPGALQTVDPRPQERIFAVHIFIRRSVLGPHRRIGPERIGEHVETAARDNCRKQQHRDNDDPDNSFHRLFSCRSGRNRRLFSLIPHPASRGCAPACRRSCARGPTRAASPTPRGRRCRPANWASSRRSPSSRDRRCSPS